MKASYLFPPVPTMEGHNGSVPEDYGDGHYVSVFDNTEKKDYDDYLAALSEAGWSLFADNGEAGLENAVFTASFTREKWAVTVTYIIKRKKTFISVSYDKPLSPRLVDREEYRAGNLPDGVTRLHMFELWWFGNSFILQLKNGHFVISDGGQPSDLRYLLDYLESLVPEGEKPVVEAWLISHAHMDHCGAFRELRGPLAKRVFVEGIYYSIAGDELYKKAQVTRVDTAYIQIGCAGLTDSQGEPTRFYRPFTGQKLYFSDVVIEVVHTQDQLIREYATGDINDSSTWFMIRAEGQKCLLTGDGERGCMMTIMETYDPSYLDMEIMTLMHHGFNTMDRFTDFCKVKTLLVTMQNKDNTPVRQANENNYLKSKVEEFYAWGDGTKILTFPYTVGSYETLAPKEWIYHDPSQRREQINIYRYFRSSQKKEIRSVRIRDNGLVKSGAALYDKIHEHLPLPITYDGVVIELRVEKELCAEGDYLCYLEDPTGWVIRAKDEETLSRAIEIFVDTARWTEKGFTPVPKEA